MRIRYKPQMHDGLRTMEQQMYLLAKAAQEVELLHAEVGQFRDGLRELEDFDQPPTEERLDASMARLRRQLLETDIFMSGYEAGRLEK